MKRFKIFSCTRIRLTRVQKVEGVRGEFQGKLWEFSTLLQYTRRLLAYATDEFNNRYGSQNAFDCEEWQNSCSQWYFLLIIQWNENDKWVSFFVVINTFTWKKGINSTDTLVRIWLMWSVYCFRRHQRTTDDFQPLWMKENVFKAGVQSSTRFQPDSKCECVLHCT